MDLTKAEKIEQLKQERKKWIHTRIRVRRLWHDGRIKSQTLEDIGKAIHEKLIDIEIDLKRIEEQ